jgi:hypothetical protein
MTDPKPMPDWLLERYRLEELSQDLRERARQALAADPTSAKRLKALAADDTETLATHPPRVVGAVVRARLAREQAADAARAIAWPRRVLVPAVSAMALVVGLSALLVERGTEAPRPVVRLKGLDPGLVLYRQGATGPEQLGPSALARTGDVLQVAYRSAGRRYGVVVSIDGRGQVTRHMPRTGEQAAPLQAGAAVPLPEAYRLDDAPGFERFFLVTSDAPFGVELVTRAIERAYGGDADPARTGTRLDLPDGLGQAFFELRKDASR